MTFIIKSWEAKFYVILTFREPRFLVSGKNGVGVGNQNLSGRGVRFEHSIGMDQWTNDG